MSVITFWNNGREQTGKTSSIVAVATYMALQHNYKILIISTGYNDETLTNCFWRQRKEKKNMGIFGPNTNMGMDDGVIGLCKLLASGRLAPEMITNYTKVVFKDRLEILPSFVGNKEDYANIKNRYPEIIGYANRYYDYVFVDLDLQVEKEVEDKILEKSDLIVASLSQRLTNIEMFLETREERQILKSKKTLILIGRYDKFSKYNIKNISRYLGEKNKVSTMPYNTLFFEACEEAKIPDLFYRIKRLDTDDRNGFFFAEVQRIAENIMYRAKDYI